jgi:hypothetical protein
MAGLGTRSKKQALDIFTEKSLQETRINVVRRELRTQVEHEHAQIFVTGKRLPLPHT